MAAVLYLVFWVFGVFMVVCSRRVKPVGEQPLPPLTWYEREQVTTAAQPARDVFLAKQLGLSG